MHTYMLPSIIVLTTGCLPWLYPVHNSLPHLVSLSLCKRKEPGTDFIWFVSLLQLSAWSCQKRASFFLCECKHASPASYETLGWQSRNISACAFLPL